MATLAPTAADATAHDVATTAAADVTNHPDADATSITAATPWEPASARRRSLEQKRFVLPCDDVARFVDADNATWTRYLRRTPG